jgi:hypothetical protein
MPPGTRFEVRDSQQIGTGPTSYWAFVGREVVDR